MSDHKVALHGGVEDRSCGRDLPRGDDIDPRAVEEGGPSQGVHDTPVCPLGAAILRCPGYVEEGSPGPDEDEACVFLFGAWLCAVLRDEVVER